MDIRKRLNKDYYIFNRKEYMRAIKRDEYALSTFRGGNGKLLDSDKKLFEFKYMKCYRAYQVNIGNIWEKIFYRRLLKYYMRYGIGIYENKNIGEGFVIGHWGRIVLSGYATIGRQVVVTHGVTIGRDIRGKRKGNPIIGDRVCIRANSTVVGNVHIGNDVLIAPNTFVNFDVPDHSIVIGNPAVIIPKDNATDGHVGKWKEDEE